MSNKNFIAINIENIPLNVKTTITPDADVWVAVVELKKEILLNNTIR